MAPTVYGVATVFSWALTLANIFFCHYEDIWLCICLSEWKPNYDKCYVDDILVLFEPKPQIESFKKLMNTHHPNMKFTPEKEDN